MSFGPLVTTGWLAARLDDPELRIADCRWSLDDPAAGAAAYADGHIPGASYVSLDDDLSAAPGPGRHPLPDRARFALTLGAIGISPDSPVVCYDDRGGAIAARMWWMLRWMGHGPVAVLDGGFTAWETEGRPMSSVVPSRLPVAYEPGDTPMPAITRQELASRLGAVTLLDARAGVRYRGESDPIDPVAGHIPTARSAPYEDNLDAGLRFLPPDVLRRRYAELGTGADGDTVVYCGSGVTACQDILAMEIAGLGTATLYPGSWSDWCRAGDPVATGPDPGTAPGTDPP